MGGKTKQSQRTKNNARPSSSSRSAELLNNSVSLDTGLVTISSGQVLPALFPSLAAVSLDQGLSPEFQMCIKKLNKKDPITRAKALQELCELVNNGSVDDVVAILPSWAHFYKTLTADTDRKVREMTQQCHGALVRVCGRRAAPQLRALLPAWLQAQYDEHAPAQAHAQHSLKNTFPDSKLPEVISFCKSEVMAHLLDNLVGNTEAIISKKIENPEVRSLQMSRIVTSSLRGLEYFVPRLPAAAALGAWLWDQLAPLLDHARHWSFAAHEAHQVRAAWYGAMGRIIERYQGQFAVKYGRRTMRVLLNAARETNALVAAQIWTCLLQFMHNVEDWQQYLDKKELLVKRILDVLETGGWGDARHLSSMLLPLLAHLPQDVLTKQFYEAFFKAVYTGLDKKNILSSKSERQSWITSLAECLRYLSIQQNDFVVEVTTSAHRTWLEKILSTDLDVQTRNNLIKYSATNMTSLVKYWLKQSNEGNSDKYDQLLRNFWQNIGSTVLLQIDKCSTELSDIERLIDSHILLLQSLKTTFMQETKKQHSIKFDKLDGDEPSDPDTARPAASPPCDDSIVHRYKHNLDELVYKIISHYFVIAGDKQVSNAILTPLITLLVEFDNVGVFVALARQFNADTPYKFYDNVLRVWLAGDTMRCKAVVDIVFLMIKYLSEEEQDAVFDSFTQLTPSVVEWCLARAMSHPHVLVPATRRWTRGRAGADAACALCRRAAERADARAAALLLACVADGPDGEPLIGAGGISQVLATVTSALSGRPDELEPRGRLAARLLTALAPTAHAHGDDFAALVLRLYALNVSVPVGEGDVSPDTWREIRSSWQDGVGALPAPARRRLLADAAQLLHDRLFDDLETLNVKKLEHVASLGAELFVRGDGSGRAPADLTELVVFSARLCALPRGEARRVRTCALRYECVMSHLNCLYHDDDDDALKDVIEDEVAFDADELTRPELARYLNKFLFCAIYLRSLLLQSVAADGDDDDDNDDEPDNSKSEETWCDALLSNKFFESTFCQILHDYVIVVSLYEGYEFWPHYDIIEETKNKMDVLLSDVIAATSEAVRHNVVTSLCVRAAADGYHWAYAHRLYVLRATRHDHVAEEDSLAAYTMNDVTSGNGFYHMLQARTRYSSNPELQYKTAYLVMLRSWHMAHCSVGVDEFVRDAARCLDTCDMDVVVNAYYRHRHTMLYDRDMSDAAWSQVVSNAAVLQFMALMVQARGWDAPAHHWDFVTVSLCSLLHGVAQSGARWGRARVAMLCRAALALLARVQQFVRALPAACERAQPPPHVAQLMPEWREIFEPEAHAAVYQIAVRVLDEWRGAGLSASAAVAAAALTHALPALQPAAPRPAAPPAAPPREVRAYELATAAATALPHAAHPAQKYLAHALLCSLAEDLVFADSRALSRWSEAADAEDEDKEPPRLALHLFTDVFQRLRDLVEAALANVELGEETCELVSLSDSHSLALGWLLLADVLSNMYDLARGDLKQFYIRIYRESNWTPALLATALRLLPGDVFAYAQDRSGRAPAPPQYADMFLRVEPFCMRSARRGASLAALACRGVFQCVCGAGCGPARGWWAAAAPRAARLLQRVVTAYVAPPAARLQLRELQRRAHEIDDAEIRIAWSTNEVVCEYTVEESRLELRVWLSRSHPLTPPRLDAPGVPGGSNTHWLALYLAYQNGTLLNALKMWTQAVNARVEKSPQCYICYCRLHPSTGRLPRVPCHQCKNKFHNMCLRKWFATSNKSNCPLCRATF